jgi:hypothetical protein
LDAPVATSTGTTLLNKNTITKVAAVSGSDRRRFTTTV